MDCVSQMWSIVPCLWDCSAKHAAYICHLEQNMETLSTEIDKLQCLYQDVKSRVEAEEGRHMMRRMEEVNNWLERTGAMDEKVTQLEQKVGLQVKKKCVGIGCCPKDYRSSYKLGKEVIDKPSETRRLIEEGRAFNVVARRLPPPAVDELPMETTVGLDAKFKEAWTCLQDKRAGVMGLYGTGGVGKTTLLKKINNEFLEVNSNQELDVVIWVLVSKPLDLGRIQEAIRAKLLIPDDLWNNKNEDLRAAEILKVLKTKKFVLMLDDLWESIELSKIGVPCPNESNMCKVVFTTRSEEVCRRMNAHEFIRVDCLPPHEALHLFYSKVGEDTLKSHRDIPNLAKIVAAECRGLPLALIATGGPMAGRRNPQEWRHAITTLQSYPARFSDMKNSVLRVLLYSYDRLENDAHKNCFLYCSLFLEDHDIDEELLIELWLGEGFLGEYDIGEARAQGEYIISSLKRACLLEDGANKLNIRMHDVIRDMALWVSDDKCVVQVGDKWTEISRWHNAQRIAIWNYTGTHLAEVPNCPNLTTLLIQSTKLEELPIEFIESMKELRVLDLAGNRRLKKLPKGIDGLTNLHYLNLQETGIYELPIEVKQMKNLKCLRVSCEKIPKKVMDSLSSLQVFHRHIDFDYLHSKKDISESESILLEREILEGVMCLEQLKDLCLHIHHAFNVELIEESPKLQGCLRSLCLYEVDDLASFTIIGRCDRFDSLNIYACGKLEEVKIDRTSKMQSSNHYYGLSGHDVKLHTLYIQECSCIRNLTSLIYASNLEALILDNCESMEEIVSERYKYAEEEGSGVSNLDIFSSLIYLKLEDLPSLRSICPHTLLFPCLEVVEVKNCPNLKKLPFDSNTANRASSRKFRIQGEEDWWNNLVWENEATKQLWAPNFKHT